MSVYCLDFLSAFVIFLKFYDILKKFNFLLLSVWLFQSPSFHLLKNEKIWEFWCKGSRAHEI